MEKIVHSNFKDFISGYSIEVIPRSAAKIESFSEVLPKNTRVYIAHIQNEDILSMVATAKRIADELDTRDGGIEDLLSGPPLVGIFALDPKDAE